MSMPAPAPLRLALTLAGTSPQAISVTDAPSAVALPADGTQPPTTVVLRAEGDHVVIEAAQRLTLRVGASALTLDADGTILLHGVRVTVAADEVLDVVSAGATAVRGTSVDIN